jgi:hypothetical protein
MFDPEKDEGYVEGIFSNYPNSHIRRLSPDRVQLLISQVRLCNDSDVY